MNKIKFVSAVAVSMMLAAGAAHAADVTSVTTGNAAASYTFAGNAANYVVNGFTFNMSANVGMNSAQDATSIVVTTANGKGRQGFSGSSIGGSVGTCGAAAVGSAAPTVPPAAVANAATNGCAATTTP